MICLLKSYWNVYRKSSAKPECHFDNVFLKADRTLSELNFLFHLNSKTNLVTLRKCVIHIICNIIKLVWASVMYAKSIRPSAKARSKKNGARSATIKSRVLGALKLASEARDQNVPAKRSDFFLWKLNDFIQTLTN